MKNAKSQNLHLQKYENTVQLNFGKKFWSLAMDFGWKNEEKLEDLIRFIQSIRDEKQLQLWKLQSKYESKIQIVNKYK